MSLWELCEGNQAIQSLNLDPWRVVEAQHVLSARDLVDTTDEHDILEDMLEESKPFSSKEKNYLLFTPFRYPPLKHGSRFGQAHEPSLWYGSLDLETAFAEVAHYQLLFQQNTSAHLGYIETSLTAFNTSLTTTKGIDLTTGSFYKHIQDISHKNNYQMSQELGSAMRQHIEAFVFFSARSQVESKNVGCFTPSVFCKKNNLYVSHQQTWKCIANKHVVEFTRMGISSKQRFIFNQELS